MRRDLAALMACSLMLLRSGSAVAQLDLRGALLTTPDVGEDFLRSEEVVRSEDLLGPSFAGAVVHMVTYRRDPASGPGPYLVFQQVAAGRPGGLGVVLGELSVLDFVQGRIGQGGANPVATEGPVLGRDTQWQRWTSTAHGFPAEGYAVQFEIGQVRVSVMVEGGSFAEAASLARTAAIRAGGTA